MALSPGVELDPQTLARYPFLPAAATWVDAEGPSIEALLEKRVWARARARGRERVDAAIAGEPVERAGTTTSQDALVEVLSYVVARMLVSAVGERILASRLAVSEARGAKDALDRDPDVVVEAVAEGLGVRLSLDDDGGRVRFSDFLSRSVDIHALDWKLVNQVVDAGEVVLQRERATRLLQEAVKHRVADGLPAPVPPMIADALARHVSELKGQVADLRSRQVDADFGEVRPGNFPKCMQNILSAIEASENVSHEGRFAVVAFMHTVGVSNETIINDVFSGVPDFAKDITRYQVEHITGVNSGTEYTPPGCQTLQTYGLCPYYGKDAEEWDPLCGQEWMNHPLKYYRARQRATQRHDAYAARKAERAEDEEE